jgi:hypothetical protein
MGSLAVGFQSECYEVADIACKVFSHVAYELKGHDEMAEPIWKWFTSFQGGLDAVLYSVHRHQFKHQVIKPACFAVLYQFSRENLSDLFDVELPRRLADPATYLDFAHSFLVCILTRSNNVELFNWERCWKRLFIGAKSDHWVDNYVDGVQP